MRWTTNRGWAVALVTLGCLAGAFTTLSSFAQEEPKEADVETETQSDTTAELVERYLEPFRDATSFTSSDPVVARIVSLGPDAVPALLAVLERHERSEYQGMAATAAEHALVPLVREEHLPTLRRVALLGSSDVIPALATLDDPAVNDILLEFLKQHGMTFDVDKALATRMDDPRVIPAVVEWLGARRQTEWMIAAAAQFCARTTDARVVDQLLAHAGWVGESQTRYQVGRALAVHGRREGIELLIRSLETRTRDGAADPDAYHYYAANVLNEVVGENLYAGPLRRSESNAAKLRAAIPRYRAWLTAVGPDLDLSRVKRPDGPVSIAAGGGALPGVVGSGGFPIVSVTRDGLPADRAVVRLLQAASRDTRGTWLPSTNAVSYTDADGTAHFRSWSQPTCLLAEHDDSCAFLCNHQGDEDNLRLSLEPGVRVHGRLVRADGEPLDQPELRVHFASGYEWHHLDLPVADDGSFRSPPLPRDRVATYSDRSYLEIRSIGTAPARVDLNDADRFPLEVVLHPKRPLQAQLVGSDGRPVLGGRVIIGDWYDGDSADATHDGVISVPSIAAGVTRVTFVAESHAAKGVLLPGGTQPAELGEIVLQPGRPIRGFVRDSGGKDIPSSFVSLSLPDGTRVGECYPDTDGAFEFPHVGDGYHLLDVYVHSLSDTSCQTTVSTTVDPANDEPVIVEIPLGVRIRFVKADGSPYMADEAVVEYRLSGGTVSRSEFARGSSELPFAEVRLDPLPGETPALTVTVDDRPAVEIAKVETDEGGHATLTVTIR